MTVENNNNNDNHSHGDASSNTDTTSSTNTDPLMDIMARLYKEPQRGTPFESRTESVAAMRTLLGMTTDAANALFASRSNDHATNTKDEEEDGIIQKEQDEPKTNTGSSQSNNTSTKQIITLPRLAVTNVYGKGPLLLSDIPTSARKPGVCVGIDEAGRGSVLGPMIYGAAFWNASLDDETDSNQKPKIPPGFNDSKQLTEETRAGLLEQLMACPDIGWCARILEASEISRNMLRAGLPYNLNQMSHDAAMAMIEAIQNAGVPIQTCYIDTVGNPEFYKAKLQRKFPNLTFVVESKADAKYATCSAASVVAKVLRDRMMEHWQFTEPLQAISSTITSTTTNKNTNNREFGSGYPSDPKCKAWMADNLCDPVFGWPDVVRFSWGPAKKTLLKDAALVTFEADEEEEDEEIARMNAAALAGRKRQQEQMSAFLKQGRKDVRYPYFERMNLQSVTTLF